jgi:hypothetical protein
LQLTTEHCQGSFNPAMTSFVRSRCSSLVVNFIASFCAFAKAPLLKPNEAADVHWGAELPIRLGAENVHTLKKALMMRIRLCCEKI